MKEKVKGLDSFKVYISEKVYKHSSYDWSPSRKIERVFKQR